MYDEEGKGGGVRHPHNRGIPSTSIYDHASKTRTLSPQQSMNNNERASLQHRERLLDVGKSKLAKAPEELPRKRVGIARRSAANSLLKTAEEGNHHWSYFI